MLWPQKLCKEPFFQKLTSQIFSFTSSISLKRDHTKQEKPRIQCIGSASVRSGSAWSGLFWDYPEIRISQFTDPDPLNMMVLMNSCWNSEYFTLLKFENLFVGSKVVIFSQKWPKFQIKTKKGKQIYAVVLNTRTLNAYNFWPDGPIFKLQKVKWSKCQNLSKGSGSGSAKTEGPGSLTQATDMLLSYYTMPVYWYSKQIIK